MTRTRAFSLIVLAIMLINASFALAADKKILVYTRNYTPDGKGYVHNNIKASVAALQKLGQENGFAVDASDDPKLFTDENLKQYKALVFSNSNNEAFENDAQREAFKKYIQAGGGFVGIHSASGSERKWDYYWKVLGGTFSFHPAQQPLELKVLDPANPVVKGLPAAFTWSADECYFHKSLNPDIKVLVAAAPAQIKASQDKVAAAKESLVNGQIPLVWCHTFDGGREAYIALGHNIPQYQDPVLTTLICNAIQWAMGEETTGKPVQPLSADQVAKAGKAEKAAPKKAKAKKAKAKKE